MRQPCLMVPLVFALCAPALAGEPERIEETLFLCNFKSLTTADFAAGSGAMTVHGATLARGKWGSGLRVKPGKYLTIAAEDNLLPEQGTLMFWFKPNWSTARRKSSHSLLSWGWADGKSGYCVLSDGWWEPAGADRTYLVFENQLYVHGAVPISYTKGEWMHFAFTWRFGKRVFASLCLNGKRVVVATSKRPFTSVPKLRTPIYVGTDKGTPLAGGRTGDGVFDGFHILSRVLSERDIRDTFRSQEPNWKQVEMKQYAWLHDVLREPYTPRRDRQGRILESRALLDEQIKWVTRKGAEAAIERLTRAGFNVYIPCIYHGRGARYPTTLCPMETATANALKQEPEGFDPLEHLIRVAHSQGVEVHPWFCVCYGDHKWPHLRGFVEEGTPNGAYEAHNPEFRRFIVKLMMEVVRKYDVDGINLDYIRTKGISTSVTAQASYRKRFGSELLDDMKRREPNGWPNPNIVKWQNEAVADIVRPFAEKARAVRPKIIISSDGHPSLPTGKPGTQGRDGFGWAQKGWIDVIYSMDYGRRLSWEKADAVRQALNRPSAYVTIPGNYERTEEGKVVPREGRLVADLIAFCQRKYPGNGVALYWMGSLDEAQIKALRAGPFNDPAIPYWLRASDEEAPK